MPQQGEFRATTDQMLELIDSLRASEERKRAEPLGSDAFVDAAIEAEKLSRMTFRWAQMQLQMALSVRAKIETGDLPHGVRLDEVQPRALDVILALWREAQLRLEIAPPGSPESEQAVVDIERLREEYQASHAAHAEQRP